MAVYQTRREFLGDAAQAGTLFVCGGLLAELLSGCEKTDSPTSNSGSPGLATIAASVSNGTITLAIDSNSPLKNVGSAALVDASSVKLLVAHTADTTFKAVSAICTHEGCTVTGFSSGTYTCPCHGSQFDTGGAVKRGPAASSLASKTTSFNGTQLTITV